MADRRSSLLRLLHPGPYDKPRNALIGIALLVLGAYGFGLWHAAGHITPELRDATAAGGRVRVAVHLGFAPEQYNLLFLQSQGKLARFDSSTVYLTDVTTSGVETIGAQYWVSSVDLWRP
jgi:hypothetical protein